MIPRIVGCLVMPALVFFPPTLLAGWPWFWHPAPLAGFGLGVLTLASQPPLSPTALITDPSDRQSALLILLAVMAANCASVIQFSLGEPATPAPGSPWVITGIVMGSAGLLLRLWAIRTLGRFFTSGVMVQEGQAVLTTGPYRWVRHPSYTGSILTVLGTAVALGSPLGVVLAVGLLVPVYLYRIRVEERTMLAGLGDAYASYRARTPALLPGTPGAR